MIDNKLISSVITVIPTLPIRGLYYIGQYGTSGYASAARGYLYHYFTNGIPITWDPLYFDNSKLSDEDVYDVVIKSLINKPLPNCDMVIMHSTPDLWPKFWNDKRNILNNKVVNGYCTWETNRLPVDWVKCINGYVNEVWCPSTYNETTFKESGVTKPIRVVPHIFLPHKLPNRKMIKITSFSNEELLKDNNRFTFYSIGEMNARKGIDDTIKSFCTAFKESDPVRLILKVHYKDYSYKNKKKCEDMVSDIIKEFPSHAPIICLFDNMTNNEMLALHSIGDCYVSLTKSEGFGLTIFDAFNYNKKIICTGYGGHMDFLGNSYSGLIDYKIGSVNGMSSFSSNYTEDQSWAYPNLDHAVELMRREVNI
jgi:glycosyltransferase involved in cell wall biosynthesis